MAVQVDKDASINGSNHFSKVLGNALAAVWKRAHGNDISTCHSVAASSRTCDKVRAHVYCRQNRHHDSAAALWHHEPRAIKNGWSARGRRGEHTGQIHTS